MTKPVVFLSHSSRDSTALARLKRRLEELTHGTVDFFLSSDGESIPFGTNWVYSVQEALEHAALMFVFVTPQSRRSSWLYFESGHAYSKGIHVVPTGLFGVDIGALPPPLSLLQGFNITGPGGLNNLIVKINETFQHTHQPAFTKEDFESLVDAHPLAPVRLLGPHIAAIDELFLYSDEELPFDFKKLLPVLRSIPGHTIMKSGGCIIPGAEISVDDRGKVLRATVAPFMADIALPVVESVFRQLLGDPAPGDLAPYELSVKFLPTVDWDEIGHVVMGKLHGTPAAPAPEQPETGWARFLHGDLIFSVGHDLVFDPPPTQPVVFFESQGPLFTDLHIAKTLNLLFEAGVLFAK